MSTATSYGNDSEMRTIVMWAFRHFSPTTANIVSRLTHTDDAFAMYETCRRLCEEGLLEVVQTGRKRYPWVPTHRQDLVGCRSAWVGGCNLRITDYGVGCTPPGPKVNQTKMSIFRGLVHKEMSMDNTVITVGSCIAREYPRSMCLYEILTRVSDVSKHADVQSVKSALFRLMSDGLVEQAGPLYIPFIRPVPPGDFKPCEELGDDQS